MSTNLATKKCIELVQIRAKSGEKKEEKVCQQRDLLSLGFSGPKHEANGLKKNETHPCQNASA
jgi:hypothetical protein